LSHSSPDLSDCGEYRVSIDGFLAWEKRGGERQDLWKLVSFRVELDPLNGSWVWVRWSSSGNWGGGEGEVFLVPSDPEFFVKLGGFLEGIRVYCIGSGDFELREDWKRMKEGSE
jgi:hypothetical protein